MGLSINDSVYSCVFFFLTGLHFFHLLLGVILQSLLFWSCSFSISLCWIRNNFPILCYLHLHNVGPETPSKAFTSLCFIFIYSSSLSLPDISFFLSFLWIGAQFPQEKFLSYGRILTLDYYFLLMCILFSINLTWTRIKKKEEFRSERPSAAIERRKPFVVVRWASPNIFWIYSD